MPPAFTPGPCGVDDLGDAHPVVVGRRLVLAAADERGDLRRIVRGQSLLGSRTQVRLPAIGGIGDAGPVVLDGGLLPAAAHVVDDRVVRVGQGKLSRLPAPRTRVFSAASAMRRPSRATCAGSAPDWAALVASCLA